MKTAELRQKSDAELREEVENLLREQFNLRMQREQVRPHLFKTARRTVARIKTLLRERKQA